METIARELGRTHSLMGKALGVLTDETIGALAVTLDTLVRVIAAVDFQRFAHHQADPYLHLYEHFLAVYDPKLRKKTGSYYTPAPVVAAMTRLTDDILRTRLGRAEGLADSSVTIVDPAMGTGTYVLRVLETIAATVEAAEGQGAVPARLRAAASSVVAYLASVTAHPAFTARYATELRTPGIHVPLTAEQQVWIDAVELGRRVLWLHTRGERQADPAAGGPAGSPRVDDAQRRPKVLVPIPDSVAEHPDTLEFDPATSSLLVGTRRVGPVSQAVYDCKVSGMNVLRKWFGYRRATPPPVRGSGQRWTTCARRGGRRSTRPTSSTYSTR